LLNLPWKLKKAGFNTTRCRTEIPLQVTIDVQNKKIPIQELDGDRVLGEIKYKIKEKELRKLSELLRNFGIKRALVITYYSVPEEV